MRKFFRRSLELLQKHNWDKNHIEKLVQLLSSHVMSSTNEDVPAGIKLHLVDIYLEELETVGTGEVSTIPFALERGL